MRIEIKVTEDELKELIRDHIQKRVGGSIFEWDKYVPIFDIQIQVKSKDGKWGPGNFRARYVKDIRNLNDEDIPF